MQAAPTPGELRRDHVVVCVDDELPILSSLQRLLRREPYQVLLTDKPHEALEWLEKRPVSVLVADQRMPEMKGTDLLKRARRQSPSTLRVMLTGYADVGAISEAINEGAIRRLITKPWNDEELKRTLRELLWEREFEERNGSGSVPVETAKNLQRLEDLVRRQTVALRLSLELANEGEAPVAAVGNDLRIACCNRPFARLLGAEGADARDVLPKEICERLREMMERPGEAEARNLEIAGGRATVRLRSLAEGVLLRVMHEGQAPAARPPHPAAPRPGTLRIVKRRAGDPPLLEVEMLDAILSAALELIYVFDPSGKFVYASRAAARAVGREREAIIGRTWHELGLPPETTAWFDAHRQEVLGAGRPVSGQCRWPTAQGTRDCEYVLNPIHMEGGAIDSIVCTVRDVTDRKRGEEALREKNLALENAVEGISRLDMLGRFVSVNKAYAATAGYEPEEMAGMDWRATVHPDDRERMEGVYQQMLIHDKAEGEARGLRRDGSVVHEHVLLTKAYDPEGKFSGHYRFVKDISERRRVDEERHLATAQLLQGQKLQAVGQLAAGIAHEINNPVGYILSNLTTVSEYVAELTKLLQTTRDAGERIAAGGDAKRVLSELERLRREMDADFLLEDLQKAIEDSREGAERIREIVRNLREFSHLDEGAMKPSDINAGLEATIRICWNELKYKTTVHRDYGELPPVVCIPQRINQVFMNLLVNAAQAIDKKGDILICTRREGTDAVVRVRDTGRGISAENMARLFEPFFTTRPVGQGTGLGLHVAYEIVKAHGGKIQVRSEEGKGTEFTIRLPIAGPGGSSSV